jgi:hypothetical protein
MPGGTVRFTLDNGETLSFAAADLAAIYELLWQIASTPGAISVAAVIRGATRSTIVGAPVDLDAKQSAAMREAMTLFAGSGASEGRG